MISYYSPENLVTSSVAIRYIDIEAVMIIPTGFLIDKKLEYIKLIVDNDSTQEITDLIKSIPQKSLGLSIPIRSEYSYIEKKIMDVEDYTIMASIKLANNSVKQIRIHVDSNSILEENIENNKILRVKELSSVYGIKVKRELTKDYLKLYFQGGITFEYQAEKHILNYLLARIMSLIVSKEDNTMPIIVREKTILQKKIQGADTDGTYESNVVKNICEQSNIESSNILDSLILDAALNIGKVQAYDAKFVQTLFEITSKYAKELKNLEEDEVCMAEYEKMIESSDNPKPKTLLNLYRKLGPLLYLIRLYLASRTSIMDITVFQRYLDILLILSSSKESIISFLTSLTIRALVKVNKLIERRLETTDKKWIIKECNVITLIFKQLFNFMEKPPSEFLDKFFFKPNIHDCPVASLINQVVFRTIWTFKYI